MIQSTKSTLSTTFRSVQPARRQTLLAALVLAASLATTACSDPFRQKASFQNADQAFSVYAISGSPLNLPSGLYLPLQTASRVDGTFTFDVAFDVNTQGQIVILPQKLVAQNPLGNRLIGVARLTDTYENVTEAPRTGYVYDSTTVVHPGETVAIQAQEASCALYVTPYLYAKAVIDSVSIATRRIWGRTTININCGFRSLKIGYPEF